MNEIKENPAVGMGVPATEERKNISDNSIAETDGKIKCVIQKPGRISEIIEIEDNYFLLCKLLGGVPTEHTLPENRLIMIFVDRNLFLPSNVVLKADRDDIGIVIGGTVIITNEGNDGNLISLTPEQIQCARAWLLKNTYQEEKEYAN